MIGFVHLTGNELTGASSVVAALAIVGGYLGVRAANQNALKLAREERASRRADELVTLKRATYARCIAALNDVFEGAFQVWQALGKISMEQLTDEEALPPLEAAQQVRREAGHRLDNVSAEIALLSPGRLAHLAFVAGEAAGNKGNWDSFAPSRLALELAMRYDLEGRDIPSDSELAEITTPVPDPMPAMRWTPILPYGPGFPSGPVHSRLAASLAARWTRFRS